MRLKTYFAPEISSYSLVSSRSLAFFSQIRLWCLPLYGRYCKQSTYCTNHCIYCTFWTSGKLLLCTCSASPPAVRCNQGIVKQSAADLCAVASFSPASTFLISLIPSLHTFLFFLFSFNPLPSHSGWTRVTTPAWTTPTATPQRCRSYLLWMISSP